MRVAIVRRAPNTSISMDVYADGLVSGLKTVRPDWDIVELRPQTSAAGGGITQKLGKYFEQYWHYPKTIKQHQADIFHIIDHSDGHLARWLASVPVVATCHDLINFLQPENASHQAALPMLSSALWRYSVKGLQAADHVVTVSAHTAKDVTKLLDISADDLTVVHNAVGAAFKPLAPKLSETVFQQYDIPNDRFYLLNVGSSQPRKNITTILNALAQLVSQQEITSSLPLIHLIKAGADFTVEQKSLIERNHLQGYITHVKKPDTETLVKLYNAANVLVAPSLYEGFGITILEAMACGTPVITANSSSLPEVAGNAALMVDPRDEDELVAAISSLRNDQSLQEKLVSRGLERTQSYTWANTAEQVACVYESVLQEKS